MLNSKRITYCPLWDPFDSVSFACLRYSALDIMYETGEMAAKIVEEKGLKQVTDTGEIEKIIEDILSANSDKVEQYKSGKNQLFGFFVGQTMKASQGKANPQIVNQILKDKLAA